MQKAFAKLDQSLERPLHDWTDRHPPGLAWRPEMRGNPECEGRGRGSQNPVRNGPSSVDNAATGISHRRIDRQRFATLAADIEADRQMERKNGRSRDAQTRFIAFVVAPRVLAPRSARRRPCGLWPDPYPCHTTSASVGLLG